MRSRLPAELADRLLSALPAMATAIAEGAWLAVVYAATSLGLHDPLELGLWSFAIAAGAGLLVARRGPPDRVATLVAAAAVLAGAAGWLVDERASSLLGQGAAGAALATHPAGWLLGVAVWRGARHPDPASDDLVVGSLLGWGIVGLALPWLVGWSLGASRASFAAEALPATLAFVAAGLVAVGLTRLDALGRATELDWRRNRAWLALLIGAVALVVVIGLPSALLLGASSEVLVRVLLGPLVGAGEAVLGLVGSLVGVIAAGLGGIASGLGGPGMPTNPPVMPPGQTPGPAGPIGPVIPSWVGPALSLALLALAAGAVVLVRRRLGHVRPMVLPPLRLPRFEERRFLRPAAAIRLPSLHLPRPRLGGAPRPSSASEAYLRLIAELDAPGLVRAPTETPAAHARRLRTNGAGALALDLLAADFELEHYGGVRLSPAEVRRAISRSLRLRRLLRAVRSLRAAEQGAGRG